MAEAGEDGGAFKNAVGGVGGGVLAGAELLRAVESRRGKSSGEGERCWRSGGCRGSTRAAGRVDPVRMGRMLRGSGMALEGHG